MSAPAPSAKSLKRVQEAQLHAAELKHYWLVSTQVEFSISDQILHRHFNLLVPTDRQMFNHASMAKAQQLAQHRLVKETFKEGLPESFAILDVFLMSVSHLGQMTPADLAEGFNTLAQEQAAAAAAFKSAH